MLDNFSDPNQLNFPENTYAGLIKSEGMFEELQQRLHPTVEFDAVEELEAYSISRNKRAVIERLITLWVLEFKLRSAGNHGEHTYN